MPNCNSAIQIQKDMFKVKYYIIFLSLKNDFNTYQKIRRLNFEPVFATSHFFSSLVFPLLVVDFYILQKSE